MIGSLRSVGKSLIAPLSAAGLAAAFSSVSYNEVAFSPKEYRNFRIKRINQLTHDTKELVVELPHKDDEMGMKVSSCVMVKTNTLDKDGKEVARPYTPTSTNSKKGEFDLVVKVYPTGVVSKYLGEYRQNLLLSFAVPLAIDLIGACMLY